MKRRDIAALVICVLVVIVVIVYLDDLARFFSGSKSSVTEPLTDQVTELSVPSLEVDLNFGTLYVGDQNQLSYRHYNDSNERCKIQLRSDVDYFILYPPNGEYWVEPYEISNATVTFAPTELGVHQADLIIGSDTLTCYGLAVEGPTRDKLIQPFSSNSIWNHPIGDSAVYVPAGLKAGIGVGFDTDHFCYHGQKQLLFGHELWPGVCKGGSFLHHVWLPDWYIIPANSTNNAIGFLLSDGRSIYLGNPASRCIEGESVYIGWPVPGDPIEDIYEGGIRGGHGGSGLSSVGGTIRSEELTSDKPIRHAIKIDLYASNYCSRDNGGYRWPAWRADSYALDPDNSCYYDFYDTASPAVMMGSLLALHPDVEVDDLGLQTYAALKLAYALQDYGAYVVDDSAWDFYYVCVEQTVPEQFQEFYGLSMDAQSGPWYNDMMKLFQLLQVVDNNGPETIGGGGSPRRPLAPPIGN